jgi:hypothetical protein
MKTRKISFAIMLCIAMLGLGSCSKFLEEDPKHVVNINNYYKTEQDAVSAINAIYAYLNSISTGSTAGVYHSTLWVTAGLASDELVNNQLGAPQFDQMGTFTYGPQNAALQEIWTMHYKTITLANIAIERIPLISMNTTLRNRLVGEAKFLRGLMYFNMVRMFGRIPLVLKEEESLRPPVSEVADIYTQIHSDLEGAETDLPLSYDAKNGRGRATKGAAYALNAKVYLTEKNWKKAAEKAKVVIDSKQYDLWENFADAFKLTNRGGKEAVFSVGFGDAGGAIIFWEVGQFLVRLLPTQLSEEGVVNAQGWQYPTQQLYDSYDALDYRRAVTFVTSIKKSDGSTINIRPYIQKYWDRVAEPKGNETSQDFPVIRYSDVLLMYAEAMNEDDHPVEAHEYINKVRKRARFDGTTYRNTVPDYVNLGKEAFRAAVLKERRLELAVEGHRWFDLVRTGTLETLVPQAKPGVVPAARNYLFPIPQTERELNSNLPNNGY